MPNEPREGDVVADKYRLEALIGSGAMGRVFRARHLLLGHAVALKFLHESIERDDLRSRFTREAQSTMAIRSEHVVQVFDFGFLPSQTPYIVLEYLEGQDLRALLRERGALPVQRAVDLILQVCAGLAAAHAAGIVHRDLKPQNLFLVHRAGGMPVIKILDFGVSKVESRSQSAHELTATDALIGSPAYVSPEQIRDARNVDERADIWSLGIVLYMLLGGDKPFAGETVAALCASIVVDPPRPLRDRTPAVPAALEDVIFRCLEKRRDQRMPNVSALADALEPFASTAGKASAELTRSTYVPRAIATTAAPTATPVSVLDATDATMTATATEAARAARGPSDTERAAHTRKRTVSMLVLVVSVTASAAWLSSRFRAPEQSAAAAASTPTPTSTPTSTSTSTMTGRSPEGTESGPVDGAARTLVTSTSTSTATSAEGPPQPARRLRPVARPPSAPKAGPKKGQVDRNGVPILD